LAASVAPEGITVRREGGCGTTHPRAGGMEEMGFCAAETTAALLSLS